MKIIDKGKSGIEWLRLAITQPRSQLTEMQAKARNAIEVLTYCARHLKEDRAPVLAAALFGRFSSRGEADFANQVMSAQRFEFGGHHEKTE